MVNVEYDQHFLTNENILNKVISNSQIDLNDIIFEIGPGKGFLTKELLKSDASKVISCELDERLDEDLNFLKENSKFELIFANALDEIENHIFTKLIANIPYAITEPLYIKILNLKIQGIIMLHGIDFYKNIEERETKWKYFVSSIYDVELLEEVHGNSFMPETKVKSALVKLTLKDDKSKKEEFYSNLWEKKDRALSNALIFSLVDTFNLSKKEAKEKLKDLKFSSEILNYKLLNLSNLEFNNLNEKIQKLFE